MRWTLLLVFAACGGGSGHPPMPDSPLTPDAPSIPGPTLTARPGQNQAHLAWTAVSGAQSYNVYRSNAKGTQGPMVQNVAAMALDDTTVTNFDPEWYTVTGVVDGAETLPSNQANAFGYDLSHWTVRREAYRLIAFAFAPSNSTANGKNIYVAAGNNGAVLSSNDGIAWTIGPPLPVDRVDSMTFGGGQFVATSYAQSATTQSVFTSPDGVTWTAHDSGFTSDMYGIGYGVSGSLGSTTGIYIAAGYSAGAILTSYDGSTWTQQTCGTHVMYTVSVLQHVVGLNSSFFAIAAGLDGACYSTNGTTWTPITLSGTAASSAYVASAVDETTNSIWLLASTGFVYQQPYDFVGASLGTAASTSLPMVSGTSYRGITAYKDATLDRHVIVSRQDGNLFGTIGAAPSSLAQLAGAVSTTPLVFPVYETMGTDGSAVFIVTDNEQILRSTDGGATLALVRDDPGGDNYSVAINGPLIALDNANGAVQASPDGVTFTPTMLGSYYRDFHIIPTPAGVTMVYADDANRALQIYESSDGKTWTQTTAATTFCASCSQYNSGWVIPLDAGGYLISMTEYDNSSNTTTALAVKGSGTSYTTSTQTPNKWFVQTWKSGGMFYGVTASVTGSQMNYVMESADGITWTTIGQLPSTFYASSYFDDGTTKYLADDYGNLATSTDGITWSAPRLIDPFNRTISRITRMGDHLIAVGANGLMRASLDGITWSDLPALTTLDRFRFDAIRDS